MGYMEVYEEWLLNPYFDEETKAELLAIKDDENEIKERFYMDLEFGTAGLRGVIGAGINRMNIYVVRKTTQGLANYIKKQGGKTEGVAIAYDSRRMSPEFADEAALLWLPTESRLIFLSLKTDTGAVFCGADCLAASQVSILQRATIRRSTTATRFTGQTALRLHRRMIPVLWLR